MHIMPTNNSVLMACHECDLLQKEIYLPSGTMACCPRCGAVMYQSTPACLDLTLAFTLSAVLFFVLATAFPIVSIEDQGNQTAATLFGNIIKLYDENKLFVAALVFVTTLLAPALHLIAMMYLLVPLRFDYVPPVFTRVFRLMQAVRPWSMVEVFMLGVLVAMLRLSHLAQVITGTALWSLGAMMWMCAAGLAFFDSRELWRRVDEIRLGHTKEKKILGHVS